MPKPTKGPRVGGSPAHERLMMANMASQLFEHGRITTTETRAKRLQPIAEKLITKAKRGDLHSRRLVQRTITDPSVVYALFKQIAPQLAKRDGGYTRITKIGNRKGDNAPMAVIELVLEEVNPKAKTKKAETKAPATKIEEVVAPVEDAVVEEVEASDEVDDAVEAVDDAEEQVEEAAEEVQEEEK